MKKIRIETKSGELVKEFEGHIQKRNVDSDYVVRIEKGVDPSHGDQIYVCTVDFITLLGFIVKEIEVEEKKPVVRWLWAIKDDTPIDCRYRITLAFFSDEELIKDTKGNFFKYKKLEFSATEFEE